MATRSNDARDDHFTRTLLDLVNKGERVLAIAGRSHTINLEPVLLESLQPATRGTLSSSRPWERAAPP
jgi:Mg-chelatase subunit ChlI